MSFGFETRTYRIKHETDRNPHPLWSHAVDIDTYRRVENQSIIDLSGADLCDLPRHPVSDTPVLLYGFLNSVDGVELCLGYNFQKSAKTSTNIRLVESLEAFVLGLHAYKNILTPR